MPGSGLEGSCIWTARVCGELRSAELRSSRLPLPAIRLPGLATNALRVPSTTCSLFYRIDLRVKGETRALSAWRPGGLGISHGTISYCSVVLVGAECRNRWFAPISKPAGSYDWSFLIGAGECTRCRWHTRSKRRQVLRADG